MVLNYFCFSRTKSRPWDLRDVGFEGLHKFKKLNTNYEIKYFKNFQVQIK